MNRNWALAPLLALLLLGSAQGQSSGYYEQGGVEYYMAVGEYNTGNMSMSLDFNGTDRLPFNGCAVMKLRPDKSLGRVQLFGHLGKTPMDLEWSTFHAPRPNASGIMENVPVDGSRANGEIQHPRVDATMAGWGEATMRVHAAPFYDPASQSESFDAEFFVTKQGFRDDETGAIFDAGGNAYEPGDAAKLGKDWELHVRVQSPGGLPRAPQIEQHQEPPEIQPGTPNYFPPTPEYTQDYSFANEMFGGQATISVDMESLSPDDNQLNFSLRAPDGVIQDSFILTPGFGGDTGQMQFPLNQFGVYTLHVNGEVAFSSYNLEIRQDPPADFDLNFWWEGVSFGSYSLDAFRECYDQVGSSVSSVGGVVARDPPPPYAYLPIVAAVLGVVTMILTGISLTVLTIGILRHHRMAHQR